VWSVWCAVCEEVGEEWRVPGKIPTMTRCLSACLSTVRIFARIKVIGGHFLVALLPPFRIAEEFAHEGLPQRRIVLQRIPFLGNGHTAFQSSQAVMADFVAGSGLKMSRGWQPRRKMNFSCYLKRVWVGIAELMTDEEYSKFLHALARKHQNVFRKIDDDHARKQLDCFQEVIQLLRIVRRDDSRNMLHKLEDRLRYLRVKSAYELLDEAGILEAFDDGGEIIFAELRRSAIPEEDVEYLSKIGLTDDEIEVILTAAVEKAHRLGRGRVNLEGPDIRPIPMVEVIDKTETAFERAKEELRSQRAESPRKKRNILNGTGEIVGGMAVISGNILSAQSSGHWPLALPSVAAGIGSFLKAIGSFRTNS
jgi:hypothetical protein